jgi:hypothetical protein
MNDQQIERAKLRVSAVSFDGPEDYAIEVNGRVVGQSGLHQREAQRIAEWLQTGLREAAEWLAECDREG